MKHKCAAIGVALTLAGMAGAAIAQEMNYGRNLAAACASCHGTNGKSAGHMDDLAGMPKDRIVQHMKDFKAGTKPATVMHQLAKGYSETQIEAIASYFSAQK